MVKSRRYAPLFLLVLVLFLAGFGGGAAAYTVTGTVVEKYTKNPLVGAEVIWGSQSTITDAWGRFVLEDVPRGELQLEAAMDGYLPSSEEFWVWEDMAVEIGLISGIPPLQESAFILINANGSLLRDGDSVDEPLVEALYYRSQLFGEISTVPFASVRGIINGEAFADEYYHEMWSGTVGMPLEPGLNTIQIRVWSSDGWARNSKVYTVNYEVERLDMRLVLRWDQDADLDLHLFKRESTEPNRFEHDSFDRHLFYWGSVSDFGEGLDQNPVLDWDGYGYGGWDGIYFTEMTPGDYHIWVYSWGVDYHTKAQLRLILDMAAPNRTDAVYEVEFGEEDEDVPVYIITVRVHEDGTKELIYCEPEVAAVAEG